MYVVLGNTKGCPQPSPRLPFPGGGICGASEADACKHSRLAWPQLSTETQSCRRDSRISTLPEGTGQNLNHQSAEAFLWRTEIIWPKPLLLVIKFKLSSWGGSQRKSSTVPAPGELPPSQSRPTALGCSYPVSSWSQVLTRHTTTHGGHARSQALQGYHSPA